uniref:Uncharacterized protein n=1 Tax=Cucumis melo TaxID=3656 RepID=A0A9I9E7U7_CUCME
MASFVVRAIFRSSSSKVAIFLSAGARAASTHSPFHDRPYLIFSTSTPIGRTKVLMKVIYAFLFNFHFQLSYESFNLSQTHPYDLMSLRCHS